MTDILVVTREFPPHVLGGLSYHLGNLYGRLHATGCEVTVLAGRCSESRVDRTAPRPAVDVEWIPYGGQSGHHLRFPAALKRHLRRFDETAYDVVVTHTPIPFDFALPTIGKYHDCVREERKFRSEESLLVRLADSVVDPTRRWVDRRSLRTVDAAIFNSELTRQCWAQYYDLPERSVVHHNGVDTDLFYPRPTDERGYLLFVGDSERKGLSTVRSYAEVSPRPLRLVGPSTVDVDGAEADGHVSQSRLARLYSGAVATIHPAKFEAFGNVVLESLACGTPVVTTDRCGASEVLDDGCGVVTDDVERGVDRVLDGETNRRACIETARRYSWDEVADRTFELIRRVVSV